ncbi:hypothetical protein ATW7_02312 [Alteromonadales bacterium TW-7]|nr:hypothetical protein ATW7_02312 [Alteromonadales bacterium TW-7]
MKIVLLTLFLLFSFKVSAVEPCAAVPEGKQRRDGVCSYQDAAFKARQVFSYVLSLKKYCDTAIQEEINEWYLSNKQLIDKAVIIGKQPLNEIVKNTDIALWQSESSDRVKESCTYVKRKIQYTSPSLFGGRVGEYLNSYAPNKQ